MRTLLFSGVPPAGAHPSAGTGRRQCQLAILLSGPAVTLQGTSPSGEEVRQQQKQAGVPAVIGPPWHQHPGLADRGHTAPRLG